MEFVIVIAILFLVGFTLAGIKVLLKPHQSIMKRILALAGVIILIILCTFVWGLLARLS